MKKNKIKMATDEEKKIIDENLSNYPELNKILSKKQKLYRIQFDQYGGEILKEQFEGIGEFSIGGVLLYLDDAIEWKGKIESLESWLKKYPEYTTKKFGERLQNNFFNYYSEIEVYNTLRIAGCNPERDVIGNNKSAKNIDFKISPYGRDILIEVTTPRMRKEVDLSFGETPNAGFFNPEFGIEINGYSGISRAEYTINKKIKNQIYDVVINDGSPVVLIINNTLAYPNLTSCNSNEYTKPDAVIIYNTKPKQFKFTPMNDCNLSKEEKYFFWSLVKYLF